MSETPRIALPSAPPGFCPRCDYPTAAGICPECGHRISERRLRRKPRSWMRRHAIGLVILPAAAAAAGWFAYSSPRMLPYLPTIYLLSVQAAGNDRSPAAEQELARRYAAGALSAKQTQQFLKKWFEVKLTATTVDLLTAICMGADDWFLQLEPRHLTGPGNLNSLLVEPSVIELRADGKIVFLSYGSCQHNCNEFGCMVFSVGVGATRFETLLLLGPQWDTIRITSETIVSDPSTGAEVARWRDTHAVDRSAVTGSSNTHIQAPGSRTSQSLPNGMNWEPGMEDLVFPYGRKPGPRRFIESERPFAP